MQQIHLPYNTQSYKIEDKKNPHICMQGYFYILLTVVTF
jgi:hypothetical protein